MKERGSQDPDPRLVRQQAGLQGYFFDRKLSFEITLSPLPTPFTGVY